MNTLCSNFLLLSQKMVVRPLPGCNTLEPRVIRVYILFLFNTIGQQGQTGIRLPKGPYDDLKVTILVRLTLPGRVHLYKYEKRNREGYLPVYCFVL